MDDRKWLLLNQLLEDLSDKSFVSEDSIRLVSQLVLELESEFTSTRISNGQRHSEEIFSVHQEVVENPEGVS